MLSRHTCARLLLAVACAGTVVSTTGPASGACLDPDDPPISIDAPVLTVKVSAARPAYRAGETVLVNVDVRTLVTAGPAPKEAEVEVALSRNGRSWKKLFGHTDSTGQVTLRLKLSREALPATVKADAVARIEVLVNADCRKSLLYQYGESSVDPLFRIR